MLQMVATPPSTSLEIVTLEENFRSILFFVFSPPLPFPARRFDQEFSFIYPVEPPLSLPESEANNLPRFQESVRYAVLSQQGV